MREGVSKEYLKGTRRHRGPQFPLDKFLRRQMGRLWDDIYSELKQEFDSRTREGYIFFRDLKYHVDLDVLIDEDGLAKLSTSHYGYKIAVHGLYVHPKTRKLCWQNRPVKERPPVEVTEYTYPDVTTSKMHPKLNHSQVILPDGSVHTTSTWIQVEHIEVIKRTLSKIDGIWYYVYWKKNSYYGDVEKYRRYDWKETHSIHKKLQVSHNDLRRLKLTNNTPYEIIEMKRLKDLEEAKEKAERKQRAEAWRNGKG